eukprot:jgi/Hompol1/1649/HPOL_000823-RA
MQSAVFSFLASPSLQTLRPNLLRCVHQSSCSSPPELVFIR